jgi:membrane-associated PAP2 superfamily phosphatase
MKWLVLILGSVQFLTLIALALTVREVSRLKALVGGILTLTTSLVDTVKALAGMVK